MRDSERTNMILEEHLRQRDADIALLKLGGKVAEGEGKEERVETRQKKERKDETSESESESEEDQSYSEEDDSDDKRSRSRNKSRQKHGETYKCTTCHKHKLKNAKLQQELTATKVEYDNLQQKLDKMKNLIQIYRQEKRQMEEYIEKEKRTAKNMISYLFIYFIIIPLFPLSHFNKHLTLKTDVATLREVLDEKQGLIGQLREEVSHLRSDGVRMQQTHAQQLAHAQDLARIQLQLKEDEVRAKLDVQANLQKEVNNLVFLILKY